MTLRCADSPVSWLRLEQYVLGELPSNVQTQVERHLEVCESCRTCLETIRCDDMALPPLPIERGPRASVETKALPRGWLPLGPWPWRVALAGGALAALALLLWPSTQTDPEDFHALPPARIRIKGGDVSLGLVREHAGSIALDPDRFATDDRFKVLLTCPPGSEWHWELVVWQAGAVSFPLERGSSPCGNRLALPGAFRLTAAVPAQVCLLLSDHALPSRALLRNQSPHTWPGIAVCRALQPIDEP
jgi:hypothetical protein